MKKSVFLSVSKTLYKKEESDLAEILKTVEGDDIDDTLVADKLKEFDAEKVDTFKTTATERFNNGIKKGTLETAKKFETKLREVFKVEDTALQGDDLLTHIEENLPEPGTPGKVGDLSKLTEEDLLKVPAFIRKQKDFQNQLKAKDTEMTEAVKAEQEKQAYGSILSDARAQALAILDGKNPILPSDAKKALGVKNKLLIGELDTYKFMKGTDGKLIPLDAEGKQLEDANGLPMDFDTLVNKITDDNFEFSEAPIVPKSPGNKQQHQQQQSTKYTGKKPENATEYTELLLSEELDTDQKVALKETYSAQFQ